MYILFVRAIITSTARASSVSPATYRNTIFNQSARVFRAVLWLTIVSLTTMQPSLTLGTDRCFFRGGKGLDNNQKWTAAQQKLLKKIVKGEGGGGGGRSASPRLFFFLWFLPWN